MLDMRMATGKVLAALLLAIWVTPTPALTPAELLDLARRSTFEVVLPKVEPEHVRYEKALPLELLSYTERTDRFWSIGTAFAIAPDTFVSAAHVLLSGIGSPMGKPLLRDASGNTFAVERILKFSLHEDFVVFRAHGARVEHVLAASADPVQGSSVFAVGNALGEGVVLRDGLLTSQTPEDQDGRWKWLRFSAAASPGNSGGPLLDNAGRVLGVITAKSPGENLNFALPIARVLDAPEGRASIDQRSSFAVPILRQQLITSFREDFALPANWESFVQKLIELHDRQHGSNQQRILAQQAGELLPRGQSARLLATLDRSAELGLIRQQADDSWGISAPEGEEETELPDGGKLWIGGLPGAFTFRLQRAPREVAPDFHQDATAFMDTLLRGLKVPRTVGPQAIRITSLGAPREQSRHTDRFGRIWQLRSWSMGFTDMEIVTLALPTPEGYSGLIRVATASGHRQALNELRLLADYFHVAYRGSIPQWRALLAQAELRPPLLASLQLDGNDALAIALRSLQLRVPKEMLKLGDESELVAFTQYRADGQQLNAELAGVTLSATTDDDGSWIGVWAQPRPGSGAGTKLDDRWRKMTSREGEFSGAPQHDSKFSEFWTRSVAESADSAVLYEVVASWREKGLLPRQVIERRDALLSNLRAADAKP